VGAEGGYLPSRGVCRPLARGGHPPVISARAVEKRYGRARALRRVTVDLPAGGFLLVTGANGSGKTTLLRLLAGLAAPTKGELHVAVERAGIGYLGHEPLLYRDLTAVENLDLYGRLYRIPERRERIGMLLERFDLWDARTTRVSAFSRGMTQRLALCRSLLHEPVLLVLDEPFTALDEDGAALLDRELRQLGGVRTIVLATHEPGRVERLASVRLALAR
jgi:heme exporter protein A